jgi:uncharacterized repeat protein (TIGR01451 family)
MRRRCGASPRFWLTSLFAAVLATAGLGVLSAGVHADPSDPTAARELSSPIKHRKTFNLHRRATHVALHWRGPSSAVLRWAFSREGRRFRPARRVQMDEVGEQRGGDEKFGSLVASPRVRAVRVWTTRRLPRVSLLVVRDKGSSHAVPAVSSASHVPQPSVISRQGWGADESLRFDSNGNEIWPPTFWPIQKLIVHHTATGNDDPNPAATIRSIYYYHAVTQGWGDIGYNFLIDESGNVYEGRYSRSYALTESPTGEDIGGNGVTGAHAQGYNSGTAGVALLGTLTNRDATAQARDALEGMLAWKAERHGIDPLGSSLYTNPVTGTRTTFPNIAGHRDVAATECPGGSFYATLPTLRSEVATRIVSADLGVTNSDSADPVFAGAPFTYTVAARNGGPSTATGVTLNVSLPRSLRLRSVRTDGGVCSLRRTGLRCFLSDLASGGLATVAVSVRAIRTGTVSSGASVALVQPTDPIPGNNTAEQTTRVLP